MINDFQQLTFSTNARFLSFKLSSDICELSYMNKFMALFFITLCFKKANASNALSRLYYGYKLNELIKAIAKKDPFIVKHIQHCAEYEIKNFNNVIKIYKDETRCNKFNYTPISCSNGFITMLNTTANYNGKT